MGYVGMAEAKDKGKSQPLRVLIVDDDEQVLSTGAEMLRVLGHEPIEALGSQEALRLIDDHPEAELLFTDIVMPAIDGITLADMLTVQRPEMKVLYTTGYMDHAKTLPGILHGRIMRKPYRLNELRNELEYLFPKRGARED
jgi:DNA-binding NtrC family response regulator